MKEFLSEECFSGFSTDFKGYYYLTLVELADSCFGGEVTYYSIGLTSDTGKVAVTSGSSIPKQINSSYSVLNIIFAGFPSLMMSYFADYSSSVHILRIDDAVAELENV